MLQKMLQKRNNNRNNKPLSIFHRINNIINLIIHKARKLCISVCNVFTSVFSL
jgi:hypothetical protein